MRIVHRKIEEIESNNRSAPNTKAMIMEQWACLNNIDLLISNHILADHQYKGEITLQEYRFFEVLNDNKSKIK